MTVALDVIQDEDGPGLRGKIGDGSLKIDRLVATRPLYGWRRMLCCFFRRDACMAPRLSPLGHPNNINGYAKEPRRKSAVSSKLCDRAPGLHEGILRKHLCPTAIAGHSDAHREDAPHFSTVERFEGRRVTVPGTSNEFEIVDNR